MKKENMDITQPSLRRICRKAGVKSIGTDSYNHMRALIEQRLELVIKNAMIIKEGQNVKTLTPEDICMTLSLMGEEFTFSTEMGDDTLNG